MKKFSRIVTSFALVASSWCSASYAGVISVDKSVKATSGIWEKQSPTIVSASDGFQFIAGDTLTIDYLSGKTEEGWLEGKVTAAGYGDFRSSLSDAPLIDIGRLIGTFANAAGAAIGPVLDIGLGGSYKIPTGAEKLQLGINDFIYFDNTGSLELLVTGLATENSPPAPAVPAVPEPETCALMLAGLGALGFVARRRKSL